MRAVVVLVRSALAAGLVALLSSCVLGSSFDPKDHCGFSGSSTCATCMASQCQTQIDACCSNASCRAGSYGSGTLEIVDACGSGPVTSCADKIKNKGGADSVSSAVFSCLETTCREACLGTERVPWSCETPRTSETPCGTCIYDSCATSLDACCTDASCGKTTAGYSPSDLLSDLDACVSGDAPGCAYLKTKSTSGKAGVVRACIETKCGSECLGNGRPHQSCNLHDGGTWCSCADAAEKQGDDCAVATVGGICVLTRGGCTCGAYGCDTSSSGCTCQVGHEPSTSTSCNVPGGATSGVCCLVFDSFSGFSCACDKYKSACYTNSGEVEVSSCDRSVVLAELQSQRLSVDRCSQ